MTDAIPAPSLAVELPLHRAKRAAQAILPHVSDDDVTPVLTAANLTNGHLIGTDRYSVGRIRLSDSDTPPERHTGNLAARIREESEESYEKRLQEWKDQHEVRYFVGGERVEESPEFMVPRAALQRVAGLNNRLLIHGKVMERLARVRIEAWEPFTRGGRSGYNMLDVVLLDAGKPALRQTFLGVIGNFPQVARLMDDWAPAEEGGTLNFSTWNLAKITRFADRYDQVKLTPGKPREGERARLAPTRLTIGDDFTALLQPNIELR
ncbi:DNA polymerase III sliding clamp beta [Microbacterium phage Gingerbug]|nr:DNA polymerase III sliding clamp beta [Microbacterium phage Gingerbug]